VGLRRRRVRELAQGGELGEGGFDPEMQRTPNDGTDFRYSRHCCEPADFAQLLSYEPQRSRKSQRAYTQHALLARRTAPMLRTTSQIV